MLHYYFFLVLYLEYYELYFHHQICDLIYHIHLLLSLLLNYIDLSPFSYESTDQTTLHTNPILLAWFKASFVLKFDKPVQMLDLHKKCLGNILLL